MMAVIQPIRAASVGGGFAVRDGLVVNLLSTSSLSML
jgi:hypothetical protein